MGMGIMICGLNGCGKSTLGKALAEATGFRFIDNENLFFSRTSVNEPYSNPRSREEAEKLLMNEICEYGDFVFASVTGDYGEAILSLYDYVVLIEAPKEIRSERIRNRSYQKFGKRMLPGGDLHEIEESFFRMAESRSEDHVEKWTWKMDCPIIKVDGTKPIEENVIYIMKQIGK